MKKSLFLLLPLLVMGNVFAAEDVALNSDLQRKLDGRSKVDQLTDEELIQIANEEILLEQFGLSPEVIRKAKELQKQEIEAVFDNAPAKMVKEVIVVDTDPSAKAPVIYTTPGHSTFVNVIDETGEPWPLALASSGNDALFKVAPVEAHKYKNVFKLTSEYRVGSSNITLLLVDKPLTFSVKVVSSKDKYHPQPILQITDSGPLAKERVHLSSAVRVRNDKLMKNLVYGIAPEKYKPVDVDSSDVKAWHYRGNLYIKTKLIPLNPRPTAVSHGPNGFSAYEVAAWPVLVMTDNNGIERQINIKGDID